MSRPYPPEFRRRVIDLIEPGQSVAEVADGLEVSDQTIYNWWNQHLIDTGRKAGVSSTDNAELTAARKRIAELETEPAAAPSQRVAPSGGAPKGGSRRSR